MPSLEWIGKKAVVNHHREVPYHVLQCDPELSVGDPGSGNLIVQGDNLLALKALLPYYARKVKCIYIDPPYNTGNEGWVYNDNVNSPEIREWLGRVVGKESDDLSRHDKWLCMMYPRLRLLRDFLRDDGVIFISIGDDEVANLMHLCASVFGDSNFCGNFIWEKKKKPSFLNASMGGVTEYVVAFARDRRRSPSFVGGVTTKGKKYPINNAGNGIRVLEFPAGSVTFLCADQVFEPQDMSGGRIVTKLLDRVAVVDGVNVSTFRLEGEWRYSQTKLNEVLGQGDSITISKAPFRPNHVQGVVKPKKMKNLLSISHYNISTYEDASAESSSLFGDADAFDYPKPERLVSLLIGAVSEDGDIVMDTFAGSGTTGAVAHKMDRRWIVVEMGEQSNTHIAPRLKKVVDGEDKGGVTESAGWKGGGGFRFCRLGPSLLDSEGNVAEEIGFADLARHVWFCETGEPWPKVGTGRQVPQLGIHNDTAVYLLFNGVLGDRRINGGNVLTTAVLQSLKKHKGSKVIYGEASRLGKDRLKREGITFKQVPYDVKGA
ncbi:MAG: site-specific DNA-methyltransferase [Planctomycetota bacterium]|jgi:DNA modification methylase